MTTTTVAHNGMDRDLADIDEAHVDEDPDRFHLLT